MGKYNKNLDKLMGNNKNPFSVPEGYFNTFPTKMQERILPLCSGENIRIGQGGGFYWGH